MDDAKDDGAGAVEPRAAALHEAGGDGGTTGGGGGGGSGDVAETFRLGSRRSWARRACGALGGTVRGLRVWLLYHFMPYDKTIFGRLSSGPGVILLLIASLPVIWLRCTFFTILLAAMLPELDQFLMIKFIVILKGSQAAFGVLSITVMAARLWACAIATVTPICDRIAPGGGSHALVWPWEALAVLWLQTLVYVAFVLLPTAPKAGELSALHYDADAGGECDRLAEVTGSAASSASSQKRPSASFFFSSANAQRTCSPASATGNSDAARVSGGYAMLPEPPEPAVPTTAADGCGAHHARAGSSAPLGKAATGGSVVASLAARVEGHFAPLLVGKQMRLLRLLQYDAVCLLASAALLVCGCITIAVLQAWESTAHAAAADGALGATLPTTLGTTRDVLSTTLLLLLSPTFWTSWQCAATFNMCVHGLYSLSMAPFLLFQLPAIDKLLSLTSPTGYDHVGRPRPLDVKGLSAYVTWLETLLRRRRTAEHLTSAEMAILSRAAKQARVHLERFPHEARAKARQRRTELDALLTTMVAPSHPLYPDVFPDRLICAQFERRLAEAQQLPTKLAKQQAYRVEMTRKFGVDWQSDRSATACMICKLKWTTLWRRRHHCRKCGQLVCDACSQARQTLTLAARPAGPDTEEPLEPKRAINQRVCDHCVLRTLSSRHFRETEDDNE